MSHSVPSLTETQFFSDVERELEKPDFKSLEETARETATGLREAAFHVGRMTAKLLLSAADQMDDLRNELHCKKIELAEWKRALHAANHLNGETE